jgi:AcrR family transcriptional regulator
MSGEPMVNGKWVGPQQKLYVVKVSSGAALLATMPESMICSLMAKDTVADGALGKPKKGLDRGGSYAKGDAKREEILRGVIDLVARNGYRRQSLREIGAALGIVPAHIIYYFSSREELLQRVIALWDAESVATFGGRFGGKPSLDLFVAAVRRNCDTPGIGHLFLSFAAEAVDPAHVAHAFFSERIARIHADLGTAIRAEQAAAIISAEVDPAFTARQLMALADGLQLQTLITGARTATDDLVRAVHHLRQGAGTEPIPASG